MKFKKIIQYLGMALVALQWFSCENRGEAEAIFKETAPERLNARSKELKEALEGAEMGWKALYFTDSLRIGGYSCLFKFKNGEVEMATDINAEDTGVHKSQYNIVLGSTVSLLFSTRNTLHNLAQGDDYPEPYYNGQGWDGSFQWLYYGQEKEQLLFKTHRNFTEVRLVKATADDWANFSKRSPLIKILKGIDKPIFRYLETTDGSKTTLYDFNYFSYTRFASTERPDKQNVSGYKGAVAYTPSGITLHPPLKVGNQLLTYFSYDWASGTFNAIGRQGAKATIKWSTYPLINTDDYMDFRKERTLQFYWLQSGSKQYAEYDTPIAREVRDKMNLKFEKIIPGVRLNSERLNLNVPLDNNTPEMGPNHIYWMCVILPRLSFVLIRNLDVKEDAVNKRVVFSPKEDLIYWSSLTGESDPRLIEMNTKMEKGMKDAVREFESYLYDSNGFYVRKGQFTVERMPGALGILDNVYTITSASAPFRLTIYNDAPPQD